jgi:cytochrome c
MWLMVPALAATGFCVSASAAPDAGMLVRGKAIAARNCGGCHAIGYSGASPNPKSPPFRFLARKYPLSNLEEALGEGIIVGHEGLEMPPFQFDPRQIEALLAYLASIQKR